MHILNKTFHGLLVSLLGVWYFAKSCKYRFTWWKAGEGFSAMPWNVDSEI